MKPIHLSKQETELFDRPVRSLLMNVGNAIGRTASKPNEPTAAAAIGAAFGRAMVEYHLGTQTGGCVAGAKKLNKWKPGKAPPSEAALAREPLYLQAVLDDLKKLDVKVAPAKKVPPKLAPHPRAGAIGAWVHQDEAVLLPLSLSLGEKLYVMAASRTVLATSKKLKPEVALKLIFTALGEALRNPPAPLKKI